MNIDRRTEEWAYMTKLKSFRNFAKTPDIAEQCRHNI